MGLMLYRQTHWAIGAAVIADVVIVFGSVKTLLEMIKTVNEFEKSQLEKDRLRLDNEAKRRPPSEKPARNRPWLF
jgi:hypothetical protein